jgi:hypothetical protein
MINLKVNQMDSPSAKKKVRVGSMGLGLMTELIYDLNLVIKNETDVIPHFFIQQKTQTLYH